MKDIFICLVCLTLVSAGLAFVAQDAQPSFADQPMQPIQTVLIDDVTTTAPADVGCSGGSCCPSNIAKRTIKRNFSLDKKVEIQQTQTQEQVVATPKYRRQPVRVLLQRLRRR